MPTPKDTFTGERWAGGRVSEAKDGVRTFWIEKQVRGTRRFIALVGVPRTQLQEELEHYKADPVNYEPPDVRADLAARDAAANARAELAGAVVLSAALIERAYKAVEVGFGRRAGVTSQQARNFKAYVTKWAESPTLKGRDLRTVTAAELVRQLAKWETAERARTNNWNTLIRWLHKGAKIITAAVFAELHLESIAPRKPTLKEIREKVYEPEHLEAVFSNIDKRAIYKRRKGNAPVDMQAIRDVVRIRTFTGMHVTEIARVAQGEAVLDRNENGGLIHGKVSYPHKSGHLHTQSIDFPTFAALDRLTKRGSIPDYWEVQRLLKNACRLAKKPEILVANLRATFVTLARTRGRLEHVAGVSGIPLALVAQIVGHTDPKTTSTFYDGSEWPPMAVIPVVFSHPDDPA